MEFKQNKNMPAEKQIVTANPDITTVRVNGLNISAMVLYVYTICSCLMIMILEGFHHFLFIPSHSFLRISFVLLVIRLSFVRTMNFLLLPVMGSGKFEILCF